MARTSGGNVGGIPLEDSGFQQPGQRQRDLGPKQGVPESRSLAPEAPEHRRHPGMIPREQRAAYRLNNPNAGQDQERKEDELPFFIDDDDSKIEEENVGHEGSQRLIQEAPAPQEVIEPRSYADLNLEVRYDFVSYCANNAELNAKRTAIGELPSHYHYYQFKELKIRPLAYIDLVHIAQAQKLKREDLILDVVQSCIDQPLADLTFGDFMFVFHWLRMNSYTKTPQIITWNCLECEKRWRIKHNEWRPYEELGTVQQRDLDEARGAMQRLVGMSAANIQDIDPLVPLAPETDVPRMRNYLEYDLFRQKYQDDAAFANIALYIEGRTLAEKFARLESSQSMQLWEDARQLASAIGDHGVTNYVNVTCFKPTAKGECGAKTTRYLAVKLLTFLS